MTDARAVAPITVIGAGPAGLACAIVLARPDIGERQRRLYRPSLLTKLIFPLAAWRYREPLRDPSCDHVDCACVWCTHGREGCRHAQPGRP